MSAEARLERAAAELHARTSRHIGGCRAWLTAAAAGHDPMLAWAGWCYGASDLAFYLAHRDAHPYVASWPSRCYAVETDQQMRAAGGELAAAWIAEAARSAA